MELGWTLEGRTGSIAQAYLNKGLALSVDVHHPCDVILRVILERGRQDARQRRVHLLLRNTEVARVLEAVERAIG